MNNPIGVFDSGYGGLTILKEFIKELPDYDYLYLGDNARAPYGTKSFETVYKYTLECVEWLFQLGCPLVILACNTASAKALRTIQQKDLARIGPGKRVLGVIRPTSEIIGTYTKTGHVGIFGTPGTVQSESYLIEINKFSNKTIVTQEACPMWVSLVENNEVSGPEAEKSIKQHVTRLLQNDPQIDTILLACTHYPLLMEQIKKHVPDTISIIPQGKIVAASLKQYLKNHEEIESKCTKQGLRQFFTTGEELDFNVKGSTFFGQSVQANHITL